MPKKTGTNKIGVEDIIEEWGFLITFEELGFLITIKEFLITIAASHLKHSIGTQPSVTVLLFRSKIRIKIFRSTKTKSIPDRDKSVSSLPLLLYLLEKRSLTTETKLSGSVSDIIHVLTENICLWGNFVAPPPAR